MLRDFGHPDHQRGHDADDRDDHQHLNQSEGVSFFHN